MDGIVFTHEQLRCLEWIIEDCGTNDAMEFILAVENGDEETINTWIEAHRNPLYNDEWEFEQ